MTTLAVKKKFILRLVLSTLAAFVAAVVAVLLLTIADLYLVGHGHASINREWISSAGVSMSLADILLLLAALGAWCVIWFVLRPRPDSPSR